jgi:hypothetical protein
VLRRIHHAETNLAEALQVLKFNRRNGVLDFASGLVDDPTELEIVDLDEISDNDVGKEFRQA